MHSALFIIRYSNISGLFIGEYQSTSLSSSLYVINTYFKNIITSVIMYRTYLQYACDFYYIN